MRVVRALLRLPVIGQLHRRQLLFPAILLLLAGALLVQGALEQAAAPPLDPEAPPNLRPEAARTIVRADLDKTPLTYFADYWAQLAEEAQAHMTHVGAAPAIAIGTQLVLTAAEPAAQLLAARRRTELLGGTAPDGAPAAGRFRLRGWDAEVGLAVFEASGPALSPFTLTDAGGLPSGSYIGAVTLDAEGDALVAPGYLVAAHEAEAGSGDVVVSMSLAAELAAVVNLDGALLGVAHPAPGGVRVTSSTSLLRLIESLDLESACRAVEVADLDDAVRERIGVEHGVLIERVDARAFRPEPSLAAGDILLVWDSVDVATAEQFRQMYDTATPGELIRYRVLRNRRRVAGGTVVPGAGCEPPGPAPASFPAAGMALEWVAAAAGGAWRVAAVRPGGAAARAGIVEGDDVLAIDGAALAEPDDDALRQAAERSEPLLVSLRRGGRVVLVLVTPDDLPPADGER